MTRYKDVQYSIPKKTVKDENFSTPMLGNNQAMKQTNISPSTFEKRYPLKRRLLNMKIVIGTEQIAMICIVKSHVRTGSFDNSDPV